MDDDDVIAYVRGLSPRRRKELEEAIEKSTRPPDMVPSLALVDGRLEYIRIPHVFGMWEVPGEDPFQDGGRRWVWLRPEVWERLEKSLPPWRAIRRADDREDDPDADDDDDDDDREDDPDADERPVYVRDEEKFREALESLNEHLKLALAPPKEDEEDGWPLGKPEY